MCSQVNVHATTLKSGLYALVSKRPHNLGQDSERFRLVHTNASPVYLIFRVLITNSTAAIFHVSKETGLTLGPSILRCYDAFF